VELTAEKIKEVLQAYLCEPKPSRFVFLEEVQMVDGRIADALAIECYGACMRQGYEVKISRSDFRADINQPDKQQALKDMVHRFYYVTPDRMINKSEIPEGAGLIEISQHRSENRRNIDGFQVDIKKKPDHNSRARMPEGMYEQLLKKAWGFYAYKPLKAEVNWNESKAEYFRKEYEKAWTRMAKMKAILRKYGRSKKKAKKA